MRIVSYYPDALGGEFGTGSAVRDWCQALAGAGADVTLVVDRDVLRLPDPDGVHVEPVVHSLNGRFRRPSDLPGLGEADVLVLSGTGMLANVVAGRRARELGVPYVVTAHGVFHPRVLEGKRWRRRAWNTALEHRHLQAALAVHVFFAEEAEGLVQLGIDVPTVVVPTGFTAREGRLWRGGGGYLLWLGRYDIETKGLDLLVDALSVVPEDERPQVRLHGPEHRGGRRTIGTMVRERGLERSVSVLGPVYGDEKQRLIEEADGCVFLSRNEGMGMAVLEAVSLGVPTLVTPFALGRMLAARDGVVIAERTPADVARGLRAVVGPRAAEIGQRGAAAVRDELAWPRLASSWLGRVEDLLRLRVAEAV